MRASDVGLSKVSSLAPVLRPIARQEARVCVCVWYCVHARCVHLVPQARHRAAGERSGGRGIPAVGTSRNSRRLWPLRRRRVQLGMSRIEPSLGNLAGLNAAHPPT